MRMTIFVFEVCSNVLLYASYTFDPISPLTIRNFQNIVKVPPASLVVFVFTFISLL